MAIKLTTAEQKRVNAGRLSSRPTYYNASASSNIRISDDFEAFLILQDALVKQEGITWLTQAITNQDIDLLRDLLVADTINSDLADVSATLQEVEDQLTVFNQFRDRFAPGKFSAVGEVQSMLSDIQHGVDRLVSLRNRLQHLESFDNVSNTNLLNFGLSEDQLAQTGSWMQPLLAY